MAYSHLTVRETPARIRVSTHKSTDPDFEHRPASVTINIGDNLYISLSPYEADTLASKLPDAAKQCREIDAKQAGEAA
ncbi:MAG: hypothetical protein ABID63_18465 [Pseudomonadota bacterium]